jgi:hypothetical protein
VQLSSILKAHMETSTANRLTSTSNLSTRETASQTANAQRSAAAPPSLEPATNRSGEAFEFRLFSNSSAAATAAHSLRKRGTHLIRIRSPPLPLSSAGAGDGDGARIKWADIGSRSLSSDRKRGQSRVQVVTEKVCTGHDILDD